MNDETSGTFDDQFKSFQTELDEILRGLKSDELKDSHPLEIIMNKLKESKINLPDSFRKFLFSKIMTHALDELVDIAEKEGDALNFSRAIGEVDVNKKGKYYQIQLHIVGDERLQMPKDRTAAYTGFKSENFKN